MKKLYDYPKRGLPTVMQPSVIFTISCKVSDRISEGFDRYRRGRPKGPSLVFIHVRQREFSQQVSDLGNFLQPTPSLNQRIPSGETSAATAISTTHKSPVLSRQKARETFSWAPQINLRKWSFARLTISPLRHRLPKHTGRIRRFNNEFWITSNKSTFVFFTLESAQCRKSWIFSFLLSLRSFLCGTVSTSRRVPNLLFFAIAAPCSGKFRCLLAIFCSMISGILGRLW